MIFTLLLFLSRRWSWKLLATAFLDPEEAGIDDVAHVEDLIVMDSQLYHLLLHSDR